MSRPEDGDGFLSRWSRRKQAAVQVAPVGESVETASLTTAAPGGQSPAQTPVPQQAPVPPQATEDGGKAELPLPSLNDIVPGSDVTAFMQKHVPDALRNAALRKMWLTDPDIRNFIEMADYQWDFNNPDSIPGWSSKLEGVDVKAMVERIFAAPPPQEALEPPEAGLQALQDSVPEASGAAPKDVTVLGDSTEKSDTSAGLHNRLDQGLIQNGAVQNNTKESSVYDGQRKRHGGALPS